MILTTKKTAYIAKFAPIRLVRLVMYSPFTYKCHKSNIKNLLMKSSEIVLIFFTCILPDYMAHDIPREF